MEAKMHARRGAGRCHDLAQHAWVQYSPVRQHEDVLSVPPWATSARTCCSQTRRGAWRGGDPQRRHGVLGVLVGEGERARQDPHLEVD
jgi:hypothetical protein